MSIFMPVNQVNVITPAEFGSADAVGPPGSVTATYQMLSGGTATAGKWFYIPYAAVGNDYEVQAAIVSGSPTGTFGSRLPLSSNQEWQVTSTSGFVTAVVGLTIFKTGEPTIMGVGQVTISAEVIP